MPREAPTTRATCCGVSIAEGPSDASTCDGARSPGWVQYVLKSLGNGVLCCWEKVNWGQVTNGECSSHGRISVSNLDTEVFEASREGLTLDYV